MMNKEAAVVLIVKDGLILSISRRNDHTKFGLIGGKLSPGETPEQAAIRETLEETGVKVNSLVQIYKNLNSPAAPNEAPFFTYCFYATDWENEPIYSEEGHVEWLTSNDLTSSKGAFPKYNYNTFEAFKKMFPDIILK